MDEDEIDSVVAICRRLEPVIHRFVERLMDRNGLDVSISVISNLATSFMAQAITMVETKGGDVDQFVKILMHETKIKYESAKAQVESEMVLQKMMTAGRDNDSPLH